MKQKVAFLLALLMLLSLTFFAPLRAAEAAAAPEEVIAEAYAKLESLNSLHMKMDLNMEMDMNLSYGGQSTKIPMSMFMTFDADQQKSPYMLYGVLDVAISAVGQTDRQSGLIFVQQSGDQIISYSSMDNGATWTTEEVPANGSAGSMDEVSVILQHGHDFKLTGTEQIDGVAAQKYVGKISGAYLKDTLNAVGTSGSLAGMLDSGAFDEMSDLEVYIWIDPQTHLPLRASYDMTDAMKDMTDAMLPAILGSADLQGVDLDVKVTSATASVSLSAFDSISPIQVPAIAQGNSPAAAAPAVTGTNASSVPYIVKNSSEQYQVTATQIRETVLADDEYVRIVAKSLEYGTNRYSSRIELMLSIQNKSNQVLTVYPDSFVINGFDIDGSMYEEIQPGATVDTSLRIDRDDLRHTGISTIADMSLTFDVSSSDYTLMHTTAPGQLRTDAPADFVQTLDESGMRLYEDENVTIIAKYLELNYSSYWLVMLVENHADGSLYVATTNVKINGVEVDLLANAFLEPNVNGTSCLLITDNTLQDIGVTQIDSIDLQFEIEVFLRPTKTYTTDLCTVPIQY